MSDVLIRPAPGFDEPIEMLSACHGRVLAQLETLRRLVLWLPEHGADEEARHAASAVLRYFRTAAVNHHEDEEKNVFPLLLKRTSQGERHTVEGLVRSLLVDHQELYASWADLREKLESIERGEGSELDGEEVRMFSMQYQNHIECEESMVLPLMRRLFDLADLAGIGKEMSARRHVSHAK